MTALTRMKTKAQTARSCQPPSPGRRESMKHVGRLGLASISALAATGFAGVAGCAGMADWARWHVSLGELAAMLERQFPREQRYFELVDVVLRTPKLSLVPERNRLSTVLSVSAKERVLGRQAQGTLALEYGLRFEPQDFSVRLAHVQVQGFHLDGGASVAPAWASLGQKVAERLLDDLTVVRLTGQRAESMRQLALTHATMAVTPQGLDVRFAKAPKG